MVRESYVYEGMFMYGCVFLWVMVGNVGSQGRTGAAMAWGRSRWSSVPVPPLALV